MFLDGDDDPRVIQPEALESEYYRHIATIPEGGKGKHARLMANLFRDFRETDYFPAVELDGGLVHAEGGSVFLQVTFENGQQEYLHMIKVPNYKRQNKSIVVPKFAEVGYVFGPCLYCHNSVRAQLADGTSNSLVNIHADIEKEIVGLHIDDRLTPYELASILSLTSCIAQLVTNNQKIPNHRVFVNVPMVEYYLYVLRMISDNLIDRDLALHWFDRVDERSQRIRQLCKDEIRRRCGLEATNLNLMDGARDLVRAYASAGKAPSIAEIVDAIIDSEPGKPHAELINDMLSYLKPDSYTLLDSVMYAVSYTQCSNIGMNPNMMLYAVDRFAENKIVRTIRQYCKHRQRDAYIHGVYPLERVIEHTCRSIYQSKVDNLENSDVERSAKLDAIAALWGVPDDAWKSYTWMTMQATK
jgi:hypothetical protein